MIDLDTPIPIIACLYAGHKAFCSALTFVIGIHSSSTTLPEVFFVVKKESIFKSMWRFHNKFCIHCVFAMHCKFARIAYLRNRVQIWLARNGCGICIDFFCQQVLTLTSKNVSKNYNRVGSPIACFPGKIDCIYDATEIAWISKPH